MEAKPFNMPKPHKHKQFADELDVEFGSSNPTLYAEPPSGMVYTYFLDGEIGESSKFRDLTMLLMLAKEEDTIKLIINGPGGFVSTGVQLCNLIAACPALVEGHIVGDACSATAMIALSCHTWVLYPTARVMVHSYSGWVGGHQQIIESTVAADRKQITHFIKSVASPFLTDEEIHDILHNGKDIWVDQDELQERLDRVLHHREQQFKLAELEQVREQAKVLEEYLEKNQ